MSKLNTNYLGNDQAISRVRRKYISSLLITTTPVIDYADHPMQPLSVGEIFPYLSKRQKTKK